jgi:hypothetical protein
MTAAETARVHKRSQEGNRGHRGRRRPKLSGSRACLRRGYREEEKTKKKRKQSRGKDFPGNKRREDMVTTP